jgi:DME family drug/metabolite transporter
MTTAASGSRHARAGALLVVGGAALFGTIGTARVLGPDADAASVGALRLTVAALALLALASSADLYRLRRAFRSPAVWIAGLAQAAFNVTFLNAVVHAGVAIGTLVAIGCTPILTGLLSRHISGAWAAATGMAIVGLVLLLSDGLGDEVSWLGLWFALGASASYATYIVASARDATPEDTMSRLAAIFTLAALALLPALLVTSLDWVSSWAGVLMTAYLALVATVLAYGLFNSGLSAVPAGTAATLGLTEPLVAAVLGVVVLDEHLSPMSWLGAIIIVVALALMIRATHQQSRTAQALSEAH